MARNKKLEGPVTLFAAVETRQHEGLRLIAFRERRSIADVVREAIDEFLEKRSDELKATRRVTAAHKITARTAR